MPGKLLDIYVSLDKHRVLCKHRSKTRCIQPCKKDILLGLEFTHVFDVHKSKFVPTDEFILSSP